MKRVFVLLLLSTSVGISCAQKVDELPAQKNAAPVPKTPAADAQPADKQPAAAAKPAAVAAKPTAVAAKPATVEQADDQDGEKLAQQVLAAAEAQDFREEAKGKVVSAVVKEAMPAELANGDADIATTGPCAADIDALCLNVPPGEGRLASCMLQNQKSEAKGNSVGRKISGGCKRALGAFFADRATNINKNLQFAGACKADAQKLCKDLPNKANAGAVLACLRKQKPRLSVNCGAQVLKAQIAAANDFTADPDLHAACSADAEKLCSRVQPGEGRQQSCLVRFSPVTSRSRTCQSFATPQI